MLPARFLELWEVLEVDVQRVPNTSEAGNKYFLLVVGKASKFLFAYPSVKGSAWSGSYTAWTLSHVRSPHSLAQTVGGGGVNSRGDRTSL